MTKSEEYISLFVKSVESAPSDYKACVVSDPAFHARQIIDGLSNDEVNQMLKDLKAENRLLAKHGYT